MPLRYVEEFRECHGDLVMLRLLISRMSFPTLLHPSTPLLPFFFSLLLALSTLPESSCSSRDNEELIVNYSSDGKGWEEEFEIAHVAGILQHY